MLNFTFLVQILLTQQPTTNVNMFLNKRSQIRILGNGQQEPCKGFEEMNNFEIDEPANWCPMGPMIGSIISHLSAQCGISV